MTARRWTSVGAVGPLDRERRGVRARVHAVREGQLAFVVLRQGCFTVQGVAAPAIPKAMVAFLGKIPSESIVDVEASVASAQVSATTQSNVELAIKKCFIVSKAVPDLPFQIVDASRNENDPKEGEVTVGLDTRLNHRVIDLRTPANQAIMRIRSAVPLLFASYLNDQGFTGVNSPEVTRWIIRRRVFRVQARVLWKRLLFSAIPTALQADAVGVCGLRARL